MQMFQRVLGGPSTVWVRKVEHLVLRIVSLAFSLASAHAIRWFFAPLDGVDTLQPVITWIIALGFGLLGYFVSRGLAHRLMNHERIRAYAPICVVVEVVEIFCNYALAAAVIQHATWLAAVPAVQRAFLTGATYVVLSIIPLVSVLLAVVDMDMERSRNSGSGGNPPAGGGGLFGNKGNSLPPFAAAPKVPSYASNGAASSSMSVPYPSYSQGYNGQAAGNAKSGGTAAAPPPFSAARPTTVLGSSTMR